MQDYIIAPVYLWAFQTNREQLKVLFPFRSQKIPIMQHPIYDIVLNNKKELIYL